MRPRIDESPVPRVSLFAFKIRDQGKIVPTGGEIFSEEIRRLLRESGLTQGELAEKLETSQGTVSRWLSGKQSPSVEHWRLVQAYLNKAEAAPYPITMVGYIGAGGEVYPIESPVNGSNQKVIPLVALPAGIVCIRVQGTSMWPRYFDGETIFYADEHHPPSSMIGKECIVKIKDGGTLLRLIRRGSQPHLFTLVGLSSPDIDDVELEWATPVRFVQRN